MSRGAGAIQITVMQALLLAALAPLAVPDGEGKLWHGMAGVAEVVRQQRPELERATIRRAVRALERAGYIDVMRGQVIIDAKGRQVGHAQNLVRLNDRGHTYLTARLAGPGAAPRA